MDAIRVEVRAYTASFRVPGMMGYQITSPVPPPSTVYGLLAAACGREVPPEETWIAYRFDYAALAQDLEKIIFFGEKGPQWNSKLNAVGSGVVTREFLSDVCLTLYLKPGAAAESLLRPRFPLVLGRSQDVAYVASHREVQLEAIESAELSGVLLRFPVRDPNLRSRLLSFPTFFTVEAQRMARAVRPFHVLDAKNGVQKVTTPKLFCESGGGRAVPLFDVEVLS